VDVNLGKRLGHDGYRGLTDEYYSVIAATLSGSGNHLIAYVGYRYALPYAVRRVSFGHINLRASRDKKTPLSRRASPFGAWDGATQRTSCYSLH
jgi:hypothetical protein